MYLYDFQADASAYIRVYSHIYAYILIGLPGGRELGAALQVTLWLANFAGTGLSCTRIYAYIRVYSHIYAYILIESATVSALCTRIYAYIRVYTRIYAYILRESATVWLANFAGTGSVYLMCTQRELGAGCSTLPCTGQCVSNVMYLMCT